MQSYYNNIFKIILLGTVACIILCTNPLFQGGGDPGYHLSGIMHLLQHGKAYCYTQSCIIEKNYWHIAWSLIFKLLPPLGIITAEKVIYSVQFALSFILVFLANNRFVKIMLPKIQERFYIVFFSTILFYFSSSYVETSWATNSTVGYQISLPLSIYVMSIFANIIFSKIIRKTDLLLFIIASGVTIIFHAAEYLYVVIFIFFILIFDFKVSYVKYLVSILLLLIFLVLVVYYTHLFGIYFQTLSGFMKLSNVYSAFYIVIPEVVYLSLFIGIIYCILAIFFKNTLHLRFFVTCVFYDVFMTIVSQVHYARMMFFFMPEYLVARFMSGSLWFNILPVLIFCGIYRINKNRQIFGVYVLIMLLFLLFLYKVSLMMYCGYSGVVDTFIKSRDRDYVSDVSTVDIKLLESFMTKYDCKKDFFVARADISALIGAMGCFSDYNYWTYNQLPKSIVKDYSKNYKIVYVPDLFPLYHNQKYNFKIYPDLLTVIK